MNIWNTIVLAIIEGLTEFLPVSSTGHMILASSAMQIHDDEFVKTFEICIQLGAIMAIALMYIKRFFQGIDIYIKLLVLSSWSKRFFTRLHIWLMLVRNSF